MTSQTLREARKYEEASEKLIGKEERPDFHLTPRTGWMNDPNGVSRCLPHVPNAQGPTSIHKDNTDKTNDTCLYNRSARQGR